VIVLVLYHIYGAACEKFIHTFEFVKAIPIILPISFPRHNVMSFG